MQTDPTASATPAAMSKECGVCGEPIRRYQCVHYGGVSCHSCRAFFRRLNQRSARDTLAYLECVNFRRKCVINEHTRRDCQRCRYDKCLSAGMRPEQVLTDEQKAVRFPKTQRKGKESGSQEPLGAEASSSTTRSPEENDPERDNSASAKWFHNANPLKPSDSLSGSFHASHSPALVVDHAAIDDCLNWVAQEMEKIDNANEDMVSVFRHLYWQSSVNVLESPKGVLVVNRLITIHQGRDHLDRSVMALYVHLHSQIFSSFAGSIQTFQELDPEDRASLLKRNSRLHLSYVLAQYLTAGTGQEQLERLAGESNAFKAINNQEGGHDQPWGTFAKVCAGYEFHDVMDMTQTSKEIINQCNNKSLMALALLFYGDGLRLKNGSKVQNYHMYYLEVINVHLSKIAPECNLWRIISALVPLANEFSKILDPMMSQTLSSRLPMHYTHEEELWLQHCMNEFGRAEESVSLGEVVLTNFVRLSLGENVGPAHQQAMYNISTKRALNALKKHPEFTALSDANANSMWAFNAIRYMALNMTMCYCKETCFQQISVMMGEGDMKIWEDKFGGKKEGSLRKVTGLDYNECCGLLPPTLAADFAVLLERVSRLLQSYETYQVLSLVVLLSPPPAMPAMPSMPSMPPSPMTSPFARLLAVRNRFIVALERKGLIEMRGFLRGIEDVQKLADILMLM